MRTRSTARGGRGERARRLLQGFRDAGDQVVHLKHVWDEPDATFMRPGTPGVEIHDSVTPADGEPVLSKAAPNGFVGTSLEADLRAAGARRSSSAG